MSFFTLDDQHLFYEDWKKISCVKQEHKKADFCTYKNQRHYRTDLHFIFTVLNSDILHIFITQYGRSGTKFNFTLDTDPHQEYRIQVSN
jgi:hypothetical protein